MILLQCIAGGFLSIPGFIVLWFYKSRIASTYISAERKFLNLYFLANAVTGISFSFLFMLKNGFDPAVFMHDFQHTEMSGFMISYCMGISLGIFMTEYRYYNLKQKTVKKLKNTYTFSPEDQTTI